MELAEDKVIFPALRIHTTGHCTFRAQFLGEWPGYQNSRGLMVQEAFKKSDAVNTQAELTINDEDALRCAKAMLQEWVDRERNVNHTVFQWHRVRKHNGPLHPLQLLVLPPTKALPSCFTPTSAQEAKGLKQIKAR